MRPSAADVTHRPTVTDHDRLVVRIAETFEKLGDTERVRALAALPPEALHHIGISAALVIRQRPKFNLVCSHCAGRHEVAECPDVVNRHELRGALGR
jgi:hypothetical protein